MTRRWIHTGYRNGKPVLRWVALSGPFVWEIP